MSKAFLSVTASMLFLVPAMWAASPQTFIYLNSQPGDYIGEGIEQKFTPADGTITVQSTFNNGIAVSFSGSNFGPFWTLDFGPPSASPFNKGVYEGAQRFAFHSPSRPGIDVSGDGRGCNTDTGRFLVSDLSFAGDGTVLTFAVDFEQHCEGGPAALYGSVRYNSSVTLVPRVSIADATTLKGNAGTSDGGLLLSLSIPSPKTVTVQYATSDGSAVRGIDYVQSAGTVIFPPNTTVQSVIIPILGNLQARGNRTFHAQLSSSVGAPLGDQAANLTVLDPNVPLTALAMSSQPGDYIGGGALYLLTIADGTFNPSTNGNHVSIFVENGDSWDLDFAAADQAPLTIGNYNHAQRYPFQPPGVPGLGVSGQGRGCNTLVGDFRVNAIDVTGGVVESFSADFNQHCESAIPALYGWIRINSSLRQMSVTNAVIDHSTNNAVFTVTLRPSSALPTSVVFATADATARAGTDYVSTTETVSFAPGVTSQTVSVPLLNASDGSKVFYGQISAPSGAPIWISQGSAAF